MVEHDFNKYPELTNQQLVNMPFDSPHVQIVEDFDAVVVRVHDGDTITLETDFRDFIFPLRFLDIDSPEMNAGGEVARDWLRGKILNEKVRIIMDRYQRVGKYGRLLGRVLHRGLDVGEEEKYLGRAKPFSARDEGKLPNLDKDFNIKKWF